MLALDSPAESKPKQRKALLYRFAITWLQDFSAFPYHEGCTGLQATITKPMNQSNPCRFPGCIAGTCLRVSVPEIIYARSEHV